MSALGDYHDHNHFSGLRIGVGENYPEMSGRNTWSRPQKRTSSLETMHAVDVFPLKAGVCPQSSEEFLDFIVWHLRASQDVCKVDCSRRALWVSPLWKRMTYCREFVTAHMAVSLVDMI